MSTFLVSPTPSLSPFSRSWVSIGRWRGKSLLISNGWKKSVSLFSKIIERAGSSRITASGDFSNFPEPSEEDAKFCAYVWPHSQRPRVCILGGGFGGLYTALRLESLMWDEDKKPQVILIDQSERFVFKPLLYELLSGEVDVWEIAPRFTDLLANTSITFLKERVKLLKPYDNGSIGAGCSGKVLLQSGLLIEYDWLVLALGSEPKLDFIPGASEFAYPFSTLEDACRVNAKLKDLERERFGTKNPIRVTIVGCGYSGVELAATISERVGDRGLVQAINSESTILPNSSLGNREAALKILDARKVKLMLGYFLRSIERGDSGEYLLSLQAAAKGLPIKNVESDMVLFTVGSKPPLMKMEPYELPLNARGQAETVETLQVKGHPRIFAIGDSSAIRDQSGKILAPTAQVAFQQADFTGWNLWAAINDRPLIPFRFQNLGEMMTLGTQDAAVSPSFVEGFTLEGPVGHYARKFAYLMRLPTDEHRMKVGMSWFVKSAVDVVSSFQKTLSDSFTG